MMMMRREDGWKETGKEEMYIHQQHTIVIHGDWPHDAKARDNRAGK
jgi:hypothetical protein